MTRYAVEYRCEWRKQQGGALQRAMIMSSVTAPVAPRCAPKDRPGKMYLHPPIPCFRCVDGTTTVLTPAQLQLVEGCTLELQSW